MSITEAIGSRYRTVPLTSTPGTQSLWLTSTIVFAPLLFSTLFAKFSLPGIGIGLLFPMLILTVGLGVVTGRLQPVLMRLALFLLMVSVLMLVQVWRSEPFSLSSMAMLGVISLAYVLMAPHGTVTDDRALRFFCNLSAFIAVAGVIQFGLQFIGGTAIAFPIETFVPKSWQTVGYNNINPLYYGAHVYKSTGFVMLEPSLYCQLAALGLTAELVYRNRTLRLLAYAAAIVVSYSGTGLLILAITLPILVIFYKRWDLLVRGVILLLVLALLVEPLNLDVTLKRAGEFDSGGSSAFIRFIGWMELFADKLWNDPLRALFGHGAGTFFSAAAGYKAGEMAHAKILFEFGVLGALLYFTFLLYCLLTSSAPMVLRVAAVVTYFMNGAYSPFTTGIVISLLLWPAPATRASDAPEEETPRPAKRRFR